MEIDACNETFFYMGECNYTWFFTHCIINKDIVKEDELVDITGQIYNSLIQATLIDDPVYCVAIFHFINNDEIIISHVHHTKGNRIIPENEFKNQFNRVMKERFKSKDDVMNLVATFVNKKIYKVEPYPPVKASELFSDIEIELYDRLKVKEYQYRKTLKVIPKKK